MLALALGGRSVAEWQASMTQAEFNSWVQFYRYYPFDDYHRHYRPAALISAMLGGRSDEHLAWLQPDPNMEGYSEAEINTFKAFGMKPPPRR